MKILLNSMNEVVTITSSHENHLKTNSLKMVKNNQHLVASSRYSKELIDVKYAT